MLTEGCECAAFRMWLRSEGNESSQNPKCTVLLKRSADAPTRAFLFSQAFQTGHVFPDTGCWESKRTQEVASVACPHGVAGSCWMPGVGAEQMGLACHPVLLPQLQPKASFGAVFPWDERLAHSK